MKTTTAVTHGERDGNSLSVAGSRLPPAKALSRPVSHEDASRHSIVQATHALQKWLHDLEGHGLARAANSERIIVIAEAAAARFCLGIKDNRTFFGAQTNELSWFGGLPWLKVALRKGSNRINFVCEQVTVGSMTLPAFALAFQTPSTDRVNELTRYHVLDIRHIDIDQAGRVRSVAPDLTTTIDIDVVEDDTTMVGLLAGQMMTGHTNRSVFRTKK